MEHREKGHRFTDGDVARESRFHGKKQGQKNVPGQLELRQNTHTTHAAASQSIYLKAQASSVSAAGASIPL